ncbi:hypothetical protein LP43_1614 [Methylophaga thiooxydans]|uniref:Uncharacterized protein n=1 Tax=Methylophaga thiooxydans TaxID=392484 RepID=A0A0A0BH09_9GAMM|nr:hypothetical protein LP43_1614 [Methylophaga thiooxydans]
MGVNFLPKCHSMLIALYKQSLCKDKTAKEIKTALNCVYVNNQRK